MKSSTAAQIAIKEHNAYMVARSIVEDSISQSGIHNHLTSSVSSILEKMQTLQSYWLLLVTLLLAMRIAAQQGLV
jgi:hypothetical protein